MLVSKSWLGPDCLTARALRHELSLSYSFAVRFNPSFGRSAVLLVVCGHHCLPRYLSRHLAGPVGGAPQGYLPDLAGSLSVYRDVSGPAGIVPDTLGDAAVEQCALLRLMRALASRTARVFTSLHPTKFFKMSLATVISTIIHLKFSTSLA